MQEQSKQSDRKRDLDGLRGVAVLFIIYFHYVCRSGFFGQFSRQSWSLLLDSSWSGVDIFFVLSGFLIGGIILRDGPAKNFFLVFYARRALRILPVGFLTVAFSYLVLFPLDPSAHLYADVPPYAYLLFVNNYWTALGHQSFSPLGPMWSLAVEQQFYVLAPAFLVSCGTRTRNLALLTIIVISPILRLANLKFSPWDFTFFRLDGFSVGILIAAVSRCESACRALGRHPRMLGTVAYALVVLALLFVSYSRVSVTQRVAIGISLNSLATGAVILMLQINPRIILSKVLSQSWLVEVGRYSYFIYAMHMPILTYMMFGYLGGPTTMYPVLAFGITLMAAWASWRFVESPLIAIGSRFLYGPTIEAQPPREIAGEVMSS